MSSDNKAIIDTLISAVQAGINPGQETDLLRRIASDLDKVFSQVNNGPLPRILARSEVDPNVAYIDVTNIFSKANTFQLTISVVGQASVGGLTLTGGTLAAGTIIKDATDGLVIQLVTGSANDFRLKDPGGNEIFKIITATKDITFVGALLTSKRNIFTAQDSDDQPISQVSTTTTGTVRQYFLNSNSSRSFEFDAIFAGGSESLLIQSDNSAIVRLDRLGSFGIFDGITAPSTVANWAQIYVDVADGDLKVKFGDGTVKTIVTDT